MWMLRILLDPIRIGQFDTQLLCRDLYSNVAFENVRQLYSDWKRAYDQCWYRGIWAFIKEILSRFSQETVRFDETKRKIREKFKFFLEHAVCERHVIITPLHLHALFAWKAEDVNVIWRAPTFPLLRLAFLYTSLPLDSAIFSSFDFASHPLRCRAM
jgi:hypothetical protein